MAMFFIKTGPSRTDFFGSLKKWGSGERSVVTFTTKDDGPDFECVIDSIRIESPGIFMFTGIVDSKPILGRYQFQKSEAHKNHKGWIETKPNQRKT